MSDMIERAARAIFVVDNRPGVTWDDDTKDWERDEYRAMARAAVAIVIEDCALVAESESIDGCEWIVAKIAARIRAAPEDSAAQAELEKLCS